MSDGEAISTPDLLKKLAKILGVSSRVFAWPVGLLNLMGALVGKADEMERLVGSLQVDSTKIRRELGWVPPYSLQQGLDKTLSIESSLDPHIG